MAKRRRTATEIVLVTMGDEISVCISRIETMACLANSRKFKTWAEAEATHEYTYRLKEIRSHLIDLREEINKDIVSLLGESITDEAGEPEQGA